MQITITIPDNVATRVIDGMAGQYGYQDTIIDGDGIETPNPEGKGQFAKRIMIQNVKEAVQAWEAVQAAETARTAAIEAVESEIDIT